MGLPAIISMIEENKEIDKVMHKYDDDFDFSLKLDKKLTGSYFSTIKSPSMPNIFS